MSALGWIFKDSPFLPREQFLQQDAQEQYERKHQNLAPSAKPDGAQQRGRRHHAEAADHAFCHQQPRSQDATAKAQRNYRQSDEAGNDDGRP